MASYVIQLSTDQDAFLEETQNLILKMLGLEPSQLEFNNDDYEDEDRMRNSRNLTTELFSYHHTQSQQFEVISQKFSACCDSLESDVEADDSSASVEMVTTTSHTELKLSTRITPTEEERRIEAAAEKLEKMAEQILQMYKDDFEALEENLEADASYSSFSSFMGKIIPGPNPMWYKIGMLFGISRYLVKKDKKKTPKKISGITSFTLEYIKNNFADYIIENGGWESVASVNLQGIEQDMFGDMSCIENAAFENFQSPQSDSKSETTANGKTSTKGKDDLPKENVDRDGDSVGSSFFKFSPVIITASAAVALAYAVMKT